MIAQLPRRLPDFAKVFYRDREARKAQLRNHPSDFPLVYDPSADRNTPTPSHYVLQLYMTVFSQHEIRF
jgi:hypothetical protein